MRSRVQDAERLVFGRLSHFASIWVEHGFSSRIGIPDELAIVHVELEAGYPRKLAARQSLLAAFDIVLDVAPAALDKLRLRLEDALELESVGVVAKNYRRDCKLMRLFLVGL